MATTDALTGPERPASPCAVVIFGATGDLTRRKLLPALYNLKASGLLPSELAIVGVGRKEKTHEQRLGNSFRSRAVSSGCQRGRSSVG